MDLTMGLCNDGVRKPKVVPVLGNTRSMRHVNTVFKFTQRRVGFKRRTTDSSVIRMIQDTERVPNAKGVVVVVVIRPRRHRRALCNRGERLDGGVVGRRRRRHW
jgi:hypothetical protein